jgi:diaminohydroxyphosphoribosylaminopyrimidine deaminase/5-amino-6-(5-phosphoribosylamino)uracil reductase
MAHDDPPPSSPGADAPWMRAALALAASALGRTSPNPVVGAVLVRDGRVVGEGRHERAGAPHAEIVALAAAGEAARGATLYVTLEPCVHEGRTPPCVPAVAAAGVARVVVAIEDPDPRVRGRGVAALRAAGIPVDVGVLAAEARRLNEAYLHRVRTGRAFVALKAAVTLDGRLGADGGDSRWITGEEARARARELRDVHDAVLVGRGTLERDDPSLDVRLPGDRRDPVAVVVDSRLSSPADRALFRRAAAGARVVVAARDDAPASRAAALAARGVDVLRVAGGPDGRVDLAALLGALAGRGLNAVLVEGGERVHTSVLAAGLAGRAWIFVAPSILGGLQGPRLVGDLGIRAATGAIRLLDPEVERLGTDILVTGRIEPGGGKT